MNERISPLNFKELIGIRTIFKIPNAFVKPVIKPVIAKAAVDSKNAKILLVIGGVVGLIIFVVGVLFLVLFATSILYRFIFKLNKIC